MVLDTGSIVVEWQTLQVASSTFATFEVVPPSLLPVPHPVSAVASSVAKSIAEYFRLVLLMLFPPCVGRLLKY
ncbi:MAG: hypothetical protein CXR31_15460 [Geobacter sp.]|nr:MAG: hypothetical protein CXR31_15460 [Geobacter sp.]